MSDTRTEAFVAGLRRIADLTEAGVLPAPITDVNFSWWFDELKDGRHRAQVAAESLAVDWTPDGKGRSGDRPYLLARAHPKPAPISLTVFLKLAEPDPEPEPATPVVAFAAELTAAARGEQVPA